MKLTPSYVADDVADGVRGALSKVAGVTNLTVTTKGSIINVKASVASGSKEDVQSVLDGYKDAGFMLVLDRRIA